MIVGMGIDVVDIERFRHIVERRGDRFVERILTAAEIDYCRRKADALPSMAVRFAAKEAMIKALPVESSAPFHWQEMSVINDSNGRPAVKASGRLKKELQSLSMHLSLTHSMTFAAAVIVLEKFEG